jgi:hypothetical protein
MKMRITEEIIAANTQAEIRESNWVLLKPKIETYLTKKISLIKSSDALRGLILYEMQNTEKNISDLVISIDDINKDDLKKLLSPSGSGFKPRTLSAICATLKIDKSDLTMLDDHDKSLLFIEEMMSKIDINNVPMINYEKLIKWGINSISKTPTKHSKGSYPAGRIKFINGKEFAIKIKNDFLAFHGIKIDDILICRRETINFKNCYSNETGEIDYFHRSFTTLNNHNGFEICTINAESLASSNAKNSTKEKEELAKGNNFSIVEICTNQDGSTFEIYNYYKSIDDMKYECIRVIKIIRDL